MSGQEADFCGSRTQWTGDEDSLARIKAVKAKGRVNAEGYVNVGVELGLSNVRGENCLFSLLFPFPTPLRFPYFACFG